MKQNQILKSRGTFYAPNSSIASEQVKHTDSSMSREQVNQVENGSELVVIAQESQFGAKVAQESQFKAATGSNDEDVGMRMLALCASASGIIKAEEDSVKSIKTTRSLLAELEPKDSMEGLIVSRLVSIHEQCMQFLATSSSAMNDQVRDLYVNMATKLARLFNETLDMLLRYRRKGEQRVIVQHLNVNDGGKAIVGNVVGSGVGS